VTRLLADREERYAADLVAECGDCGDYAHPSATQCESCGQKLFPSNTTARQGAILDGHAPAGQEVAS
jgi:uncharacterized OB-fold protein